MSLYVLFVFFPIVMTRPEGFEPSTLGFGNLRSTN